MQHDKLLLDDAYHGSDGSIIGTLGGLSNKEVHHYTFQPSKQIVSNGFFYAFSHRRLADGVDGASGVSESTWSPMLVCVQINSQLKSSMSRGYWSELNSLSLYVAHGSAHNATIINK